MFTIPRKGLAVLAATISILMVISCPSSFASSEHDMRIKTFTSPDDQFSVNSVIVEGDREVMLVDAQLTKTSAEKVLHEIVETKKPLSTIYITHEHADHFLGLQVFKDAFPQVRVIATSAVVERINKVYPEKLGKWQKLLGPGATTQAVEISRFDDDTIDFEGSKMQVIKDIQGDTDLNTMLWIPGQRILIAGDVLFNDIHLYTGETDSTARAKWLDTLKKVRALKPSVVIPGHCKPGAALDATTAVNFTERYLLAFEDELKTAKNQDDLINAMKRRFPSAGLILAIERGAKAAFDRQPPN
jgi:glyoxylase-like metal-dependent hydrolase (beta-lactamase superfamily II)